MASRARFMGCSAPKPMTQAQAVEAGRGILPFLDARSLSALLRAARAHDPESQEDLLATTLSTGILKRIFFFIPGLARARVANALLLPLPPHDNGSVTSADPDVSLYALPFSRGGLCSWLEALDEVESWGHMRTAAEELVGDPAEGSPLLPSNAILLHNLSFLRLKEDRVFHVFPGKSLYYSLYGHPTAWEQLFTWRARLVQWVRNLSAHFRLRPTVVADAIALAGECLMLTLVTACTSKPIIHPLVLDRYIYSHGETLTRAVIQLLFITSLCIAAHVCGTPDATLERIRRIARDYSDSDFDEMERLMTVTMATDAPPTDDGGASGTATSSAVHHPRPSPRSPVGILDRFSPDGQRMQPPDFELVVETTPMSIAGHLLELLPAAWVRTVASVVQDLLFVAALVRIHLWTRDFFNAMPVYFARASVQEMSVQRFNPICISVSVVYLGLRSTGFARSPSSTFWIVLCQRALHLDLLSVRECAVAIEAFARTHDVPHNAVVFDMSDAASDAALTAAAAALQGSAMALTMASVEPLPPAAPHSPVTAGLTSISETHPATFQASVVAEALMAGADPDHLSQLVTALRRLRRRALRNAAGEVDVTPAASPVPDARTITSSTLSSAESYCAEPDRSPQRPPLPPSKASGVPSHTIPRGTAGTPPSVGAFRAGLVIPPAAASTPPASTDAQSGRTGFVSPPDLALAGPTEPLHPAQATGDTAEYWGVVPTSATWGSTHVTMSPAL